VASIQKVREVTRHAAGIGDPGPAADRGPIGAPSVLEDGRDDSHVRCGVRRGGGRPQGRRSRRTTSRSARTARNSGAGHSGYSDDGARERNVRASSCLKAHLE